MGRRSGGGRRIRRNVKVATECRKSAYVSVAAAETAMSHIRRDHGGPEGFTGAGRVYRCDECGRYHITGMEAEAFATMDSEAGRWQAVEGMACGHRVPGTDHAHVCALAAGHALDHQCRCKMRWGHR